MLQYPELDPVAVSIGPVSVHWYGLMYLIGFLAGGLLGVYRARSPDAILKPHEVWDLLFYVAVGVLVGGRLGYALFYNFDQYLSRPHELLYIWSGGMSFHGGLVGVLVAVWLFAIRTGRHFLDVSDFLAPLCPIGLGAGRIGNFINQELWGRTTELPWGMIFPAAGPIPRHPSQLYEALLEGVILFVVLWVYSAKPRERGAVSGLFLVGYAVFRFLVEFVREPDPHLGVLAFGWLTMGQLLTVPMVLLGGWLIVGATKKPGRDTVT